MPQRQLIWSNGRVGVKYIKLTKYMYKYQVLPKCPKVLEVQVHFKVHFSTFFSDQVHFVLLILTFTWNVLNILYLTQACLTGVPYCMDSVQMYCSWLHGPDPASGFQQDIFVQENLSQNGVGVEENSGLGQEGGGAELVNVWPRGGGVGLVQSGRFYSSYMGLDLNTSNSQESLVTECTTCM